MALTSSNKKYDKTIIKGTKNKFDHYIPAAATLESQTFISLALSLSRTHTHTHTFARTLWQRALPSNEMQHLLLFICAARFECDVGAKREPSLLLNNTFADNTIHFCSWFNFIVNNLHVWLHIVLIHRLRAQTERVGVGPWRRRRRVQKANSIINIPWRLTFQSGCVDESSSWCCKKK